MNTNVNVEMKEFLDELVLAGVLDKDNDSFDLDNQYYPIKNSDFKVYVNHDGVIREVFEFEWYNSEVITKCYAEEYDGLELFDVDANSITIRKLTTVTLEDLTKR